MTFAGYRGWQAEPSTANDLRKSICAAEIARGLGMKSGAAGREAGSIVFDVSGHGFGHLGQIAPIVQELFARRPDASIVVRSALADSLVRSLMGDRVALDRPPPECTLVMCGPTVVDVAASAACYRALHANWDEHLERETERLAGLAPAVLVADVPYLSLAAARRLGVPAVGLCSLNWLDVYRAYCAHEPGAAGILRTIESAYHSADVFLQPRPHMPMLDLANRQSIGPVARIGRRRKEEIKSILGLGREDKIVLLTFGGVRLKERVDLPVLAGVHWLVGGGASGARRDATDIARLDMSFIDILSSCDAVVTKVGYGTFVEAACNGVGLISTPRADWPEAAPLIAWARENANFSLADGGLDDARTFRAALLEVLDSPARTPVPARGVVEAAGVIAGMAPLDS